MQHLSVKVTRLWLVLDRIELPPLRNKALEDVIRRCLDRNPATRITMRVCR